MPTNGRGARGRRDPTSSPISARARAAGTASPAASRRVRCAQAGGYWLVASHGGVFTFGNARFFGSAAATPFAHPVTGWRPRFDEGGYSTV